MRMPIWEGRSIQGGYRGRPLVEWRQWEGWRRDIDVPVPLRLRKRQDPDEIIAALQEPITSDDTDGGSLGETRDG